MVKTKYMLVGVISIVSRYVRMISTDVAVLIGKIGMMNDGFSYASLAERLCNRLLICTGNGNVGSSPTRRTKKLTVVKK